MPRNSNGTFTLVAGNPVIVDTLIDADWANTTLPDIAAALTASLSRNGNGGMLAPLVLADGSAAFPAASFASDARTGAYLPAVADYRVSVTGVDRIRVTVNGLEIWDVGDSAWYSVTTSNSLGAFEETVTLAALQTVVPFVEVVAGASMYLTGAGIDRGRLLIDDEYTYDAVLNEVTLATSYAAGTKLTAVYQNETGALQAASASAASAAEAAASAEAAAAAVAAGAAGTTGTSTTSLDIDKGAQSLTIETGKDFLPGHSVKIAYTGAAADEYMSGIVTAYDAGTGALEVSVAMAIGEGTYADWAITLTAALTLANMQTTAVSF